VAIPIGPRQDYEVQKVAALLLLIGTSTLAGCTSSSTSGVPRCTTAQLNITASPGGVAAGHSSVLVRFRNVVRTSCSLIGYPSIADVGSNGAEILGAVPTPNGYIGGLRDPNTLPETTLRPGETATSIVEAVNSANYQPPCPTLAGITGMSITPPGQARGVTVTMTLGDSICSQLEVHPVVKGQTGDR
jgi:hypothetical protein